MTGKQTYSSPLQFEFDKLDGSADKLYKGNKAVVVSSSGREFTFLKLSAGGGSAVVSLYEAGTISAVNENRKRWVMDAGQATPDINVFPNPLHFVRGMVAVLEQGSGTNPILSVAVVGDK